MDPSLRDARSLRRLLETVIIAASAGCCTALFSSCGSAVEEPTDSEVDAAADSSKIEDVIPPCSPYSGEVSELSGSECQRLEIPVTFAPVACGFGEGESYKTGVACARWCTSTDDSLRCEYLADANRILCSTYCAPPPVDGRRSPGVFERHVTDRTLDHFFAIVAHNEAASVDAFGLLYRELRSRRAPAPLLRGVERARRDEARHASRAARLTRQRVPRVLRRRVSPRSVLDVAVDNAREGCGRELFGACVGLLLAQRATTQRLRAYYASITRDELRHASLSFRLHDWLSTSLTTAERAMVHREMIDALRTARVMMPAEVADIGDCAAIAQLLADALDRPPGVVPPWSYAHGEQARGADGHD
jgi:hypothetical protein